MTNNPKPLFAFGILAILALLVIAGFFGSLYSGTSKQTHTEYPQNTIEYPNITSGDPLTTPAWQVYRPTVGITDPTKGVKDAPVDIVEYGDFQCPFCADVQPTLQKILEEYDGIVRVVWKDFPNPIHPEAMTAAVAARCAQNQGLFWEYHDFLFENQDQLDRQLYTEIAQKLDLDIRLFDQCLDDKAPIERIGATMDEAGAMQVSGTPHFLINGHRLDYAGDYTDFALLVERAIVDIENQYSQ